MKLCLTETILRIELDTSSVKMLILTKLCCHHLHHLRCHYRRSPLEVLICIWAPSKTVTGGSDARRDKPDLFRQKWGGPAVESSPLPNVASPHILSDGDLGSCPQWSYCRLHSCMKPQIVENQSPARCPMGHVWDIICPRHCTVSPFLGIFP